MPPMKLRSNELRLRTFVYQPLYVKQGDGKKYACATMLEFPFCRVMTGDTFAIEKRTEYNKMERAKKYKVEDCYFSTANKGEFIIILEGQEFASEEKLKKFKAGKTTVI